MPGWSSEGTEFGVHAARYRKRRSARTLTADSFRDAKARQAHPAVQNVDAYALILGHFDGFGFRFGVDIAAILAAIGSASLWLEGLFYRKAPASQSARLVKDLSRRSTISDW